MNHEPECPIGKAYGVLDDHCICYSLRSAYQRGREDAASDIETYIRDWMPSKDSEFALAAARGDGANGSVGGVQTVARGDSADPWINPTPKEVHHDN